LTRENLGEYVDDPAWSTLLERGLPPQKISNLLRFYLLNRYGGVWADATCYCCRPLDDWLPAVMTSGFFAFRFLEDEWVRDQLSSKFPSWFEKRPHDRIVSSWFLAASKGNPLPLAVYERHRDYFMRFQFPLQKKRKGRRRLAVLSWLFSRNALLAQWWTAPPIAGLGVFPYFIVHYTFARVITENRTCRDIWFRTPVVPTANSLRLIRTLLSPISEEQKTAIQNATLYKLTWKYRHDDFKPGCVLDYLMQSVPAEKEIR
jgi:hypothetical protein